MTKTADVIGNTQVVSTWGNEIRDRSLQIVASAAERDASFPSPVKGQAIYIASGDVAEGLYIWNGTAWRLPWNMPWGPVVTPVVLTSGHSGIGVTTTDINGATISFTAIPNRLYRIKTSFHVQKNVATQVITIYLTDSSNNQKQLGQLSVANVPGLAEIPIEWIATGLSGAQTFKYRGVTGSATFDVLASAIQPYAIIVEDIGPNGAPA